MAAAAFSHWPLDALVHRPELPLAAATSPTVGLGLWNHMPVALATEAAIVVLGLTRFVRGADLSRGKIIALTILNLVIPGFTLAGMTIAPAPPSAPTMAGSSLATIAALCALTFWFGKSAS